MMATKCETCKHELTDAEVAAGRCPRCRTRIRRPNSDQASSGEAGAGETLLPKDPDSGTFAATFIPPTGEEPAESPPESGSQRTADTSLSLSSPIIKTLKASLDDPSVVPPGAVQRGMATAEPVKDITRTGGATGKTAPRRNDSIATVDPRYFSQSDWQKWGKDLTGRTKGSDSPPGARAGDDAARRSTSTDSRYVGKTPVSPRALSKPGVPPTPSDEYAIVSELGEGGMGIVYMANQRSIARDVALKMLKPETARRKDRRDSLATEAIVTGELAHPNIVPIYDLGQDNDGSLFYTMKRVEGLRWDMVLGKKSEDENLDVFLKVADAVAFAHDRGVVNRDLKPENVFLGGFGEVLVMDWGLAYATDRFKKRESIIENVSMGGSPAYMAPEQARNFLIAGGWRAGTLEPITPAIDIYLLGAMLFEVVTGQPPHGSDDPTLCVVAASKNEIRHVDIDSQLLPIALKAMATEPADRYATVIELQQAVREYRAHSESLALTERARQQMQEGDLARAVVAFEDAIALWPENPEAASRVVTARRRLNRRRYALTAVTAAFFLAIATGGSASTIFWRQAEQQRALAVEQRDEIQSKNLLIGQQIIEITHQRDENKTLLVRAENERQRAIDNAEEAERQRQEAALQRDQKEQQRRVAVAAQQTAEAEKLRADTERDRALAAKTEADEQRRRQEYLRYKADIANVDRLIADNQFGAANERLDNLQAEVPALCGWEWGRLKFLCTLGRQSVDAGSRVAAVAATADGSLVVTGGEDGRVLVWNRDAFSDPDQGALLAFNTPHDPGLERVASVAVSPNGRRIAAAGEELEGSPAILVWPTDSRDAVRPLRLEGHSPGSRITSIAFFQTDDRLLSLNTVGELIIWNLATARPLARLDAGRSSGEGDEGRFRATCAAASPDGTTVVVGTADGAGTVYAWTLAPGANGFTFTDQRIFLGHQAEKVQGDDFVYRTGSVTAICFTPDGRFVLSGDDTGRVLRWNPRTDAPTTEELIEARTEAAAARIAALANSPNARPPEESPFPTVPAIGAYDDTTAVLSITARTGPDGRTVVSTSGEDGVVKLWDESTWSRNGSTQPLVALRGHHGRSVTTEPVAEGDTWTVFSAGDDGTARLWQLDGYAELREYSHETLTGHSDSILAASFDPSGRYLLTAGAVQDRRLLITDLEQPKNRRQSTDSQGAFVGTTWVLTVPPDGRRLITASRDGATVLWDVESRTAISRHYAKGGNLLLAPSISADGRFAAVFYAPTPEQRSIALWPLDAFIAAEPSATPPVVIETRGDPSATAFTADGRLLVSGDRPSDLPLQGGFVYLTDVKTGQTDRQLVFGDGEEGRVIAITPLPDGDVLLAGKGGKNVPIRILRWNPKTRKSTSWSAEPRGAEDLAAMAIDSTGRRLVTLSRLGEAAQKLELWDLTRPAEAPLQSRGPLTTLRVTQLAISPDGRNLLIATQDVASDDASGETADEPRTSLRLLDLETLTQIPPDSNAPLLTAEQLGQSNYRNGIAGIAFSADGTNVFLAGLRGVYEFDLKKRQRLAGVFGSHGAIPASAFSSDGRFILSGRQDGSFDIYDTAGDALEEVQLKAPGVYDSPVRAAAFSPLPGDYRFLIAVEDRLTLREFDPAAGEARIVKELAPKDATASINAAAFSPDGRWIAAACDDGLVRLFDTTADDPQQAMFPLEKRAFAKPELAQGHTDAATAIAFSQESAPGDLLVLASGSRDQTAIIWIVDPASRRVSAAIPLKGHTRSVTGIAFAPGRLDRLVTGSDDRTARFWDWDGVGIRDWEDARELRTIEPSGETLILEGPHTEGLTAVGFSPDGLTILTAGLDGRAVLWPSISPPELPPVEAVTPAPSIEPPAQSPADVRNRK